MPIKQQSQIIPCVPRQWRHASERVLTNRVTPPCLGKYVPVPVGRENGRKFKALALDDDAAAVEYAAAFRTTFEESDCTLLPCWARGTVQERESLDVCDCPCICLAQDGACSDCNRRLYTPSAGNN